jgi:AP-3 complex subunit beta
MADFTAQLKSRVSALADNAREITLDFEAASGSRFFDNDDQTMKEVQTLLAGRLDREKLEALRRLVAVPLRLLFKHATHTKKQLMSRGTDVSSYFASVIQLIASPNLEIKKLVYIYLLRYAESNPDLALMSINTIQKSLSDNNQIVRAMALRVMSGIRVPLISGLVIIGIQRCLTDLSFFVRKTAAIAIIKCYE